MNKFFQYVTSFYKLFCLYAFLRLSLFEGESSNLVKLGFIISILYFPILIYLHLNKRDLEKISVDDRIIVIALLLLFICIIETFIL